MNFLSVILYFLHVIVSIFLIGVVLLQQGKGADLAVFGGGASQAAFGARGAANILHRLTVGCFVVFIFTTLAIGIVQGRASTASVISDDIIEEPAADSATEATDETQAAPADPEAAEGAADGAQDEAGSDSGDVTTDPEAAEAVDGGDGSEPPGDN